MTKKKTANILNNMKLHEDLKRSSYKSSTKRIRKQLPKQSQRSFSSYIHAHKMDSLNDMLSATIARPRSILGGSILALLGVLIGVYFSKYYGYSYNYLLLFICFVVGYVIELLVELFIGLFVRYR